MGTWGIQPWENDAAADWFEGLFTTAGLAERVQGCLESDLLSNAAEIRAAAYVVKALGRLYIWPTESLDRCLQMAITRLIELRDHLQQHASTDDREQIRAIEAEIAELMNRQGEVGS